MESELLLLAQQAATTVVTAMASDGWQALRGRLARLFGRGERDSETQVLRRLDRDCESLAQAGSGDTAAARMIAGRWHSWFADLLEDEPSMYGVVQDLVAGAGVWDVGAGSTVAGHDIQVNASQNGIAAAHIGVLNVNQQHLPDDSRGDDPVVREARHRRATAEAALPEVERRYGARSRQAAHARAEIANLIGESGDPVGAVERYRSLIPLVAEIWGPLHSENGKLRQRALYWSSVAGQMGLHVSPLDLPTPEQEQATRRQAIEAEGDRLRAVVAERQRTLGSNHVDTLNARVDLANWIGHTGDNLTRRNMLYELLPSLERELGSKSTRVYQVKYCLTEASLAADLMGAPPIPGMRRD